NHRQNAHQQYAHHAEGDAILDDRRFGNCWWNGEVRRLAFRSWSCLAPSRSLRAIWHFLFVEYIRIFVKVIIVVLDVISYALSGCGPSLAALRLASRGRSRLFVCCLLVVIHQAVVDPRILFVGAVIVVRWFRLNLWLGSARLWSFSLPTGL